MIDDDHDKHDDDDDDGDGEDAAEHARALANRLTLWSRCVNTRPTSAHERRWRPLARVRLSTA